MFVLPPKNDLSYNVAEEGENFEWHNALNSKQHCTFNNNDPHTYLYNNYTM